MVATGDSAPPTTAPTMTSSGKCTPVCTREYATTAAAPCIGMPTVGSSRVTPGWRRRTPSRHARTGTTGSTASRPAGRSVPRAPRGRAAAGAPSGLSTTLTTVDARAIDAIPLTAARRPGGAARQRQLQPRSPSTAWSGRRPRDTAAKTRSSAGVGVAADGRVGGRRRAPPVRVPSRAGRRRRTPLEFASGGHARARFSVTRPASPTRSGETPSHRLRHFQRDLRRTGLRRARSGRARVGAGPRAEHSRSQGMCDAASPRCRPTWAA